jgi:biotin carboxyl carrier protein
MDNNNQNSNNGFNILVVDDTKYETKFTKKYTLRKPYEAPDPKKMTAFIPGTIPHIYASQGQTVRKGDKLLVLEAMKMKNNVLSPLDGTIKKIYVKQGQRVAKNELLIEFE